MKSLILVLVTLPSIVLADEQQCYEELISEPYCITKVNAEWLFSL